MRRIYWDSMLFIYWMDAHPDYFSRVDEIFRQSLVRRDQICTSILTIGEVMVLPLREQNPKLKQRIEVFFASGVVQVIPIDRNVINRFAQIRASVRVAPADALHLACACECGTDIFVTNDKALQKHSVPGIESIVGLDLGSC